MRILARFAAPLALLPLLGACSLERPQEPAPAPAPAAAPAAAPAPAPAPALSEAEVLSGLNVLINDTAPGSDDYAGRRAALAPAAQAANLPQPLRWTVSQVLAFDPPRLHERWQNRQEAQENAAALYAANPPENFNALKGARVLRRLGPALYLLRLPGGDTVLLNSTRRLKNGTRLKTLLAAERLLQQPDKAKGDLVDELADQPRTFVEISRQEAKRRESLRAPALAQLKSLESQSGETERAVAADLARLDTLTRDVNAAISPRLLPQGQRPAPAMLIRKVRRISKSYSRDQYYRYALPVTGKAQVDAVLKAYLGERKAEVQDLLRSTGVGRGRMRANTDRIAFTAYTASRRLLSFRFEELRDTGGAHPNRAYASFVFDMQRQARLSLADIFSDEPAALKILAELAARRMELALDGAVFPEGVTPRPANFAVFVLDGADIVFTFPPYQVASFAQGSQTLRVPLCHPRLLPLLTPGLLEALAGN
jgi:hypothetical protein